MDREPAISGDELKAARELILGQQPGPVPICVRGSSFTELQASVQPAKDADQRIVDNVADPPSQPHSRNSQDPGKPSWCPPAAAPPRSTSPSSRPSNTDERGLAARAAQ